MTLPASNLKALEPYRFTWSEVLRMAEAGLFERLDGWRVELIDGELISVSPQSLPHSRVKTWLIKLFVRDSAPERWTVFVESPLVASDISGPQPDLYVFPAGIADDPLETRQVVLVIEVSVSSLQFDLRRKADLYAEAGVQEYWVVDVAWRRIVTHRRPAEGRYAAITTAFEGETIAAAALPEVQVAINDMPR